MAEPTGAARGALQLVDVHELRSRDGRDDELRDAPAARQLDALLAEIDEDDADLAAVVGVDRAGAVQAGDPVAQREPAARSHRSFVPERTGDRDAGRPQRAIAGPKRRGIA